MSKSYKMKKCEICGKIYDVNSTLCLGLFCNHNELVEIFGEDSKALEYGANKSKKCPNCGTLYDMQFNICLGLFCARAELINVISREDANPPKKTAESSTLSPQKESVNDVYYED